jgi:hypothetical protein
MNGIVPVLLNQSSLSSISELASVVVSVVKSTDVCAILCSEDLARKLQDCEQCMHRIYLACPQPDTVPHRLDHCPIAQQQWSRKHTRGCVLGAIDAARNCAHSMHSAAHRGPQCAAGARVYRELCQLFVDLCDAMLQVTHYQLLLLARTHQVPPHPCCLPPRFHCQSYTGASASRRAVFCGDVCQCRRGSGLPVLV